jgi:hypothetical protein
MGFQVLPQIIRNSAHPEHRERQERPEREGDKKPVVLMEETAGGAHAGNKRPTPPHYP